MKNFRNAIVAAALAVVFAASFVGGFITRRAGAQAPAAKVSYAPVPSGTYNIDPAHSLIGFAVRHLEINWVEGRFKDFKGTINFDAKDVTKSSVEFTAKVASIDTEVEARDKHLRTADFFDAEKYPEMTFKSTGVERKGKDGYVLRGDLTLKGVTKPVALPFTVTGAVSDPWGNTRFGIEAHTKINRRDFGVNYGNAFAGGGLDVGNEVTIDLRLEAVQPAPKPAGR
jgi:polyisoprenoid-binding protein YceI